MSDVTRFERLNPFRPGVVTPEVVSPRKQELLRKVRELRVAPEVIQAANPTVRELTVRDLNDLAAQFAGVPTTNPAVRDLTVDDLRNIEEVFTDFKLDVAERFTTGRAELASVDVSCCCCTPCCCCAAAVEEPVTL